MARPAEVLRNFPKLIDSPTAAYLCLLWDIGPCMAIEYQHRVLN